MALLQLRGIGKRFGATVALEAVDLDIESGQVHALIGENGAGKSTLLNILSGLMRQDRGTIELAGERYEPDGPAGARKLGIAHIHQELALAPHLSVAENILMGIEPASHGWLQRSRLHDRAALLLTEFGRGEIDPARRTGALSLADQQVVEICRALAFDARIILMDEPTSSLQRSNVERLFHLIDHLRARGIAVVYISHFLEEVREIADRFTVLRDGRGVGSGDLRSVTDGQLISMMVGRTLDAVFPQPPPATAGEEVVLAVRGLASPPRLREAAFDLRRGEILGIAGLIGSGRTELVRTIFGLQPATAGTVLAHGTMGYLSEDRKGEGLALRLSIADNITLSRFTTCSRGGWIDLRMQDEQSVNVMQRLRVKAAGPRTVVQRLSGGNQQKVAVGRLLHQDPEILLLDEPARGIDIGSKGEIARQITALAAQGKAILIVSSYIPELLGLCHRIAVMTRGRLSAARPVSQWTADSILETAIGGSENAA